MAVKAGTMKQAAMRLLCEVTHYERADLPSGPENRFTADDLTKEGGDHLRSVGLSYGEVWSRLRDMFPTNIWVTRNSIQWYVSKVRRGDEFYDGWVLPQRRPRTTWTKGGEWNGRQAA